MHRKEENKGVVELAQLTLQTNREHLDALKSYTQRLEAELETLDKHLDAVDSIDNSDLDVGSSVTIPGSVRATAPISAKDLLSPEFPFHQDVLRRTRYQSFTQVHPMKPKELEALVEAVQAERYRKHALDIQRSCPTLQNADTQTAHTLVLDAGGLDWNRIAEKVSVISVARTARDCEIRWLGEQHPEFNHESWSEEEIQRAKSLAAEFVDGQPDWVAVAERLGTRRTPLDCMRHATSRKAHQWTAEADGRLLKAIRMYGHDNWYLVARYVSEDATPSQCSSRFGKTLDQSVKHTPWSPGEDARLSAAVAAYGSSWVDVAANIPGRHNDQCRDRWSEQVNPSINKSEWREEEDRVLLDYGREHENISWKEISERLSNGRTEAMCRGRYASLHKGAKPPPAKSAVSEVLTASINQAPVASEFTSSSKMRFKASFPKAYSHSTTPAYTENHLPNEIIFLEPVVGSNPESHEYHKSRSQKAIADSAHTATMPPSKKRKTRSRSTKSKTPTKEAQHESTD